MPAIGLAEAARLTGKNQSTIHRAMKAGWLSYTKGEAGERKVDVAELERVFGLRRDGSVIAIRVNGASRRTGAHPSKSHDTHVVDAERVIAAQRETIARHQPPGRRTLLLYQRDGARIRPGRPRGIL
jgi:hypothetical protein